MTPTLLTISLRGRSTKAQVLHALGEALQLGGPGGNHPVPAGGQSGWGLNWDALFDCLLNLHAGGIWGTSPALRFPLRLVVTDTRELAQHSPEAFAILIDVLKQTRKTYAQTGRVFTSSFANKNKWIPAGGCSPSLRVDARTARAASGHPCSSTSPGGSPSPITRCWSAASRTVTSRTIATQFALAWPASSCLAT